MDSPGPDCVPGAGEAFRFLLPVSGPASPSEPRTAACAACPASAQELRGNRPPCARFRASYPGERLDPIRAGCGIQFPGNGRRQYSLRLPGTEFRNLLESGQAALLDTKLETEHMEVDFRGALERLRDKRSKQRFEALRVKQDRSPEEETEMLRLLRERNQVPASPSNNAIISGSRSTP